MSLVELNIVAGLVLAAIYLYLRISKPVNAWLQKRKYEHMEYLRRGAVREARQRVVGATQVEIHYEPERRKDRKAIKLAEKLDLARIDDGGICWFRINLAEIDFP